MTSGKFQFECIPDNTQYSYIGIANADAGSSDFTGGGYFGNTANSWGLLTSGNLRHNQQVEQSGGAQIYNGYVVTVTFDADIKQAKWYVNGNHYYTQTLTGPYPFFFGVGAYQSSNTVNFGQRPFIHPVSGFKALCTQNLDDPTIADGSHHFDAKLYSGNGGEQIVGGGIRYSDYVTGYD